MPKLEEVFQASGTPTYTFVQTSKYTEIKIAVRTDGRCLIIEGPSGIGKSTTISKILADLNLQQDTMTLTSRLQSDVDFIRSIPELGDIGIVIVDDFHLLDDDIQLKLSDYMKYLADSGSKKSKLILIGINKSGQKLVKHAPDLGLRVSVFKLESNSDALIEEMIEKGEEALNIRISDKKLIAQLSQGSFQLAQLLCHKLSILDGVEETMHETHEVTTSVNLAVEDVMVDLARQFKEATVTFARGPKLRQEGRAPYLHLLKWLSESEDWSLDISDAMAKYPAMKASISQVIDKGYLSDLIKSDIYNLNEYFHFEKVTKILSVEDPKLIFYMRNIIWRVFIEQVGYKTDMYKNRFDFAISFAGTDREFASKISAKLKDREIQVFYDFDNQHDMLAVKIEDYLAPIYKSEAAYILVVLTPAYPQRIWTKFESDAFKSRFGEGEVIPIRFKSVVDGFFNEINELGGFVFDEDCDHDTQIENIVETLSKRLMSDRNK